MNTDSAPTWYRTLVAKYTSQIAHSFILHFNIHDYVVPGRPLYDYLQAILAQREIIARYNRAEGITFALPSMRTRALALLGLEQQPAGDPLRSALAGLQRAGGSTDELPRAPSAALPLLERLLRSESRVAVLLDYAETLLPAADLAAMSEGDRAALILVQRWGRDAEIAAAGNLVILTTSTLADLHPALRAASARFEAIEVPLPDLATRLTYCRQLAVELGETEGPRWELDPQALAVATAGLGLIHIQDIVLRAQQEGTLTRELVRERKAEIVAGEFGEVLEIREPRFGLAAIGGLAHVKRYLERSVICPLRNGNTARCPAGLLFTGPAGTGKTAMAEALAHDAGVNFVSLNLGRILGSYVGQSERNLERALRAIVALAPVIVMIDEIDQTVGRGGGGDSGVSSRLFKRLLEFMSDALANRGRVLVVAATNRPDLVDAALRRPGRLDKKIPFLAPDEEERAGILVALAVRSGLALTAIPAVCLRDSEGWTGAELEAGMLKAGELVEDEGISPEAALERAITTLSPSTADIEYMTMLALAECNDSDLLPERYRPLARDRAALAQQVADLAPSGARPRAARAL